jgi:hypothetical protein
MISTALAADVFHVCLHMCTSCFQEKHSFMKQKLHFKREIVLLIASSVCPFLFIDSTASHRRNSGVPIICYAVHSSTTSLSKRINYIHYKNTSWNFWLLETDVRRRLNRDTRNLLCVKLENAKYQGKVPLYILDQQLKSVSFDWRIFRKDQPSN